MANVKSVVITINDDAMDRIDNLIEDLKSEGLQIEKVMKKLGVISGTASNLKALKKIDGVMSVEEEIQHQLPPRNSKIQ